MTDNEKIMYEALVKIQLWFGQFPPTGKYWINEDGSLSGREMSYASCYGSNGERDYMRKVAQDALNKIDSLSRIN